MEQKKIIDAFFQYIWMYWSISECNKIYGELSGHIWDKWVSSRYDIGTFYSLIDERCQQLLIGRAMATSLKES